MFKYGAFKRGRAFNARLFIGIVHSDNNTIS